MPDLLTRTCPCCGTLFEPSTYSAVTCGPACSKRAYRLRQKHQAHKRGERNVTEKVLADARRVTAVWVCPATAASYVVARSSRWGLNQKVSRKCCESAASCRKWCGGGSAAVQRNSDLELPRDRHGSWSSGCLHRW